jgi:hypothetical protein
MFSRIQARTMPQKLCILSLADFLDELISVDPVMVKLLRF